MTNNTISPEKLEEIKVLFEKAKCELIDNELNYDGCMLNEILSEGANAITWHHDIEFDELPRDLVITCDDLHDEVWNSFDDVELIHEFINEFLDEFY